MSNKKLLPPRLKDTAILLGWIAGLVLLAGLLWFLTQPYRNQAFLKAINQVLEESGDARRFLEPLSPGIAGAFGVGAWYTVTGGEARPGSAAPSGGFRAYVFTFFGEGSFFPCAAIVNPEGKIVEFVPLNSHGKRMIKMISSGVLKIYEQRIEGEA